MGHHYPHPTVRAHGVANCAGNAWPWRGGGFFFFFFGGGGGNWVLTIDTQNNGFLTPHLIGFWYSFSIPNLNVII